MIDQDQNHQSLHVIEMNGEDDHVAERERRSLMEKTGVDHRLIWSCSLLGGIAVLHYVDAACCYRWSSVVCVSVGLSVCHDRELCQNR